MCGITGFISYRNKIDAKKYYKAHRKIAHRGPDDEGFIFKNDKEEIEFLSGEDTIEELKNRENIVRKDFSSLILGHRRLSIIDLSANGHQPFFFDGLYLVYNGEIYNYIELRDELIQAGYSFETQSDTEVFLKAYHCWKEEAFNKFNGMWAAAIYSDKANNILLTRDRFGIKPLYYAIYDDSLYFASETKFIRDFIDVSLNKNVAKNYLENCYLDFSEETFFNEVNELSPGSYLLYQKNNFIKKTYWKYKPKINKNIKYEDAKNVIQKIFNASVDLRMRSDVEVGSLLSGGLDSNAIVGSLNKRNKMSKGFKVFSVVFEDEKFSEKKYIDIALAENKNLKENYIYPNPKELKNKINEILHYQEFPFRSLAVFSQFEIYEYIKKNTNTKVLLNGQGSDEQFAGYTYHYTYLLAEHLLNLNLVQYIKELNTFSKNRNISKIKETISVAKLILKTKFQRNILMKKLFSEFKITPMREYLRYEDRNSMMASVESRLPFLDYDLIEYSFGLPNKYKIRKGTNKKILRDIVKEYIPEKILNRKDKMGFISPQEIWQKGILKNMILESIKEENDLEHKYIEYIKQYYNNEHNDWAKVWRIFCFIFWRKNIWRK